MKIAIAGWSGLVGSELLSLSAAHSEVKLIHTLGRKTAPEHNKIRSHQVDFSDLDLELSGLDAAFCCLGTTIKKAGSKDAFYQVDHDFVINFAKWAKSQGCKSFHFVSATGNSKSSFFFYNRVKAETEEDLWKLEFDQTFLYRPSLLLGDRQEFRLGEKIGEAFMKLLTPVMLGKFKRYRPVHARQVASAMLDHLMSNESGVVESEQMLGY